MVAVAGQSVLDDANSQVSKADQLCIQINNFGIRREQGRSVSADQCYCKKCIFVILTHPNSPPYFFRFYLRTFSLKPARPPAMAGNAHILSHNHSNAFLNESLIGVELY